MKRVLFLGNGLNNLEAENEYSWSNILLRNIDKGQRDCFLENNNLKIFIPYPFFSDIFNTKEYLNELGRMKITELGKRFLDANKVIITTNYSKELEDNGEWKSRHKNNEIRYNLFREYCCENKSIWYIHGRIDAPCSIVMGQNHYIDQAAKIGQYLDRYYSLTDKLNFKFLKPAKSSWIDYFFAKDCQIDIVGLTMSLSELDLWYLLKRRKEYLEKTKIKNKVVFHALPPQNDYEKCRDVFLKMYGVEIANHGFNKQKKKNYSTTDYKDLYERILATYKTSKSGGFER